MPAEPAIKRAVAFVDGQNLFYAARAAFGYHFPNYDVLALQAANILNSTCVLVVPIHATRDMIETTSRRLIMKTLKFVVEKHRDGYVAYPLGLKGAVVGEGDSYDSALADAKSAAAFHIESFGKEAFEDEDEVMEAFIAEASLVTG